MKNIIALLLVFGLSACGHIKGYFPDKEKDYQLTTEIPELIVPSDLTDTVKKSDPVDSTAVIANNETEGVVSESRDNKQSINVDLVESSGGVTRIQIADSIERSWRIVGKALSSHSIEITKRNEQGRFFHVQYDPDFKVVEDGSLWDEVLFIFGSDPAKEKEFKVRLAENGSLTEVIVLDSDDQPLSEGAGLKLLELLYKTIKDDLSDSQ
jgi:outer membrane protein assembly factor BamC